jgi:hypothetical protein
VTAHPNAEWLARQLTEACGWDEPPRYLIRDRDGAYGAAFIRRIRAMGIRDRPVSAVQRPVVISLVSAGVTLSPSQSATTPAICMLFFSSIK